jgi:hypothetical protein
MAIYFASAVGTDRVKIGFAEDDVVRRVASLATGCPFPLRIVRLIADGTEPQERWLHRHFKSCRVHLEWFVFCDEMLTVEPPSIVSRAVTFPIIRKLGSAQTVLRKMGQRGHTISRDCMRMWGARGTIPGDATRTLMQIAEEERLEFSAADFMPVAKKESAA